MFTDESVDMINALTSSRISVNSKCYQNYIRNSIL